MDRSFVMPAASALTLCVTTGCSSIEAQFIGDWIATSIDDGDSFYELPKTYTDTYDGVLYTYAEGKRLLVQDDGRAAFGGYYVKSASDGAYERSEYLKSGSWVRTGSTFVLEFSDDDDEIDMDCTLEAEDDLRCEYEQTYTYEDYDDGDYETVTRTWNNIVTLAPRPDDEE